MAAYFLCLFVRFPQRGECVLDDGWMVVTIKMKTVIRADRKIVRETEINMCVTLKRSCFSK